MMNEEIEQVKRDLRSYRYRVNRRTHLQNRLSAIIKQLEGVSGISYDRIPMDNMSTGAKSDGWYDLIEEKEKVIKQLETINAEIDYVQDMLDQLEDIDKDIIVSIYVDRVGIQKLAKRLHYHPQYLYEKAQKIIKTLLLSTY